MSDFPDDVIDEIGIELKDNTITLIDNQIIDTCTELFVFILKECASRGRTNKKSERILLDKDVPNEVNATSLDKNKTSYTPSPEDKKIFSLQEGSATSACKIASFKTKTESSSQENTKFDDDKNPKSSGTQISEKSPPLSSLHTYAPGKSSLQDIEKVSLMSFKSHLFGVDLLRLVSPKKSSLQNIEKSSSLGDDLPRLGNPEKSSLQDIEKVSLMSFKPHLFGVDLLRLVSPKKSPLQNIEKSSFLGGDLPRLVGFKKSPLQDIEKSSLMFIRT